MIETARNSTQLWELDQMRHMNVQFYVDRAADGLATISVKLGMNRPHTQPQHPLLVPSQQHIRFLRERAVGSPFYLRGGITDFNPARVTVYQEMVGTVADEIAATFVTQLEARSATTHEPGEFPESVMERAGTLKIRQPADDRPNGLQLEPARSLPTLPDAIAMGMLPTFQAPVHSDQCDRFGWLRPRHFMGMASNAVPTLLAHIGGAGRDRADIGGAALQFRFVYYRYPRAGDVAVMRSAVSRIGDKTYNFCHWLFDLDTGEALASAETVIATLDLKARKIIPLPPEVRAKLETHLLRGLGV